MFKFINNQWGLYMEKDGLIEINISRFIFTIEVKRDIDKEYLLNAMNYSKIDEQGDLVRYQKDISYRTDLDKEKVRKTAREKLQTFLDNFINGYQVIDVELKEPPYLSNIRIQQDLLKVNSFAYLDTLHEPNKIGK